MRFDDGHAVEPVFQVAPVLPRSRLMRQQWRDLTFVHWAVEPDRVGPAVPWVGSFLEANVRLYSVDRTGRRGVVFSTWTPIGLRWWLQPPRGSVSPTGGGV